MENQLFVYKEEIKKNPYNFICDWAEECLIYTGRNVFSILSLIPCSLILPDIPSTSGKFRSNINLLLLGNPSSGKSTICSKFEKITYYPYFNREFSSAGIQSDLPSMPLSSIIIEDFSQILDRPDSYGIIKVLEGILGEEKRVSKVTKKEKINFNAESVALICGTNKDLLRYINELEGGLFWRFVPFMIVHSPEERENIGKYINNGVGDESKSLQANIKEEVIIDYYKFLFNIQGGKNPDIPPIVNYEFNLEWKNKIFKMWKRGIEYEDYKGINDFNWNRELQEGYRFIVAHAFLNILNRNIKRIKIEGKEYGILIPNEEDYKIGIGLMKKNIIFKGYIIKAIDINRRIDKKVEQLKEIINSNIPSLAKEILINIYSLSKGN
ncbi:MAG: hypothetical protein QW727_03945 [Candidatus Pacearchaeota archaeon]